MKADTYKVLLVDDDPTFLYIMRIHLQGSQRRHYETLQAEDGVLALSIYQANQTHIAAVLLDTEIGKQKGYEILDRLREENYQGPAAGLSSNQKFQTEWEQRGTLFYLKNTISEPGRIDEIMDKLLGSS